MRECSRIREGGDVKAGPPPRCQANPVHGAARIPTLIKLVNEFTVSDTTLSGCLLPSPMLGPRSVRRSM